MHTCFGVPGLSGYPGIHDFVPALIMPRCWGVPNWYSWWFGYWTGQRGCLGTWSTRFPGRTAAFQAAASMALWPWCARRLVAGPFALGTNQGCWGRVYFVYFVAIGAMDKSPPAPTDVQVTHTTPTRRSALYAPLFVRWVSGGPGIHNCRRRCHRFWQWVRVQRLTVSSPRSNNTQSATNNAGLQAGTVGAAFCVIRSLGHGGGVGPHPSMAGVCGGSFWRVLRCSSVDLEVTTQRRHLPGSKSAQTPSVKHITMSHRTQGKFINV